MVEVATHLQRAARQQRQRGVGRTEAVINSAKVQPGQTVAVWGAGGVGLCAVAAASIAGAAEVIAVDVDDEKLKLAAQFGATEVVNAKASDPSRRFATTRPRPTALAVWITPSIAPASVPTSR